MFGMFSKDENSNEIVKVIFLGTERGHIDSIVPRSLLYNKKFIDLRGIPAAPSSFTRNNDGDKRKGV